MYYNDYQKYKELYEREKAKNKLLLEEIDYLTKQLQKEIKNDN